MLPGQALPPGVREQLNSPILLPSMYLRSVTKAFQVRPTANLLLFANLLPLLLYCMAAMPQACMSRMMC